MEQSSEGIGIKIYSASQRVEVSSSSSMYTSNLPQDVPIPELAQPAIGGKKRRAMANGVQKTLSKTSLLVNFLPTGTLLTFEMLLPSVFGKGDCSPITTLMILTLLGLCTSSCFFFHFTDSFRGTDGKVYYGFVTPRGLKVFKTGLGVEVPKDERYIVGFTDLVHAMMSVLVFVAIAFSDHRVTLCLFPGHAKELDEIMRSFPLMVGVICSGLFLVFPNTRYGVGCMGTAPSLPPIDQLVSTLLDAIEAGYRHFDTAAAYGSEEALGRAVAEALRRRLIKSRKEVFITSKLWCTEAHHDLVLPALKRSLARLGMDYLDLYLIHWPVRMKNGSKEEIRVVKEDIIPFDMKGTWEAMEECYKLGLAKSIGVCNFSCTKLSQLLHHATIPPAANQVEMHVAWRQEKMVEFCKEKGIHVSAWSPLGANGIPFWGTHAVMQNPVLKDIAFHKQKSIAQVALRWVYEQGVSVLVKSFNKDRMKENLQILDWELSDEELTQIQEIPQCRGYKGEDFVHQNGPYKSVEELWDGEV